MTPERAAVDQEQAGAPPDEPAVAATEADASPRDVAAEEPEQPTRLLRFPGAAPTGPTLSFAFNLAKVAGQGEDADPVVRDGPELGLIAVFDGMGGAGGTVYETPEGPRTGAYLASRVARDVVEERMLDLLDPDWNLDGPATALELHRSVRAALTERLADLNAPPSGLRSRLLRALPTTMALVALQHRPFGDSEWTGHVLWSGDSRAYVFEPDSGAHQVSTDDIRDGGDAMANLREDSVVSNAMSADTDFVVHHRRIELTAPFLVVAATDGCFGYLPSPMHFEHLVLGTLQDSADPRSWSAAVQAAITAVAGDDASMSVLGVGADHATFKALFAGRAAQVERDWVVPLDRLDAELREAERRLATARSQRDREQAQLWGRYKPCYERYLQSAQQEAP